MSADFDVPPYTTGTLRGQAPVEPGFTASNPWIEQNGASDYQVNSGGLSMPAHGTVAGVNGGTGRVVENGAGSFRIARVFSGQTGTETELWFRAVIAPPSSSATGNTIFSNLTGTNRIVFTISPTFVMQSINGAGTGSNTPYNYGAPNLIVIRQIINRAPGQADATYGWINPTSYADLIAGVNYNAFVSDNIIDGTDTYNGLTLNWENSKTQGDSIAIATSLNDLVQPVPGPLPLMGAASAFAFSRKLRQRIKSA